MNQELVFEDDAAVRPKALWPERLAAVAEHPGRWVNIRKTWGLTSMSQLDHALIAARKMGLALETRTISRDDGTSSPAGRRRRDALIRVVVE